jgi:hypothetical protein
MDLLAGVSFQAIPSTRYPSRQSDSKQWDTACRATSSRGSRFLGPSAS